MTTKYRAELYKQGNTSYYEQLWSAYWFCREFAQRDVNTMVRQREWVYTPLSVKISGANMRDRTLSEQEGMCKFGNLLMPNHLISVDSRSIWFDSWMSEGGTQIYPSREVYSLLFFYIKYLSIQMDERVDFDKVCKSLIKRKHQVFRGIPDQQLGTALYFYSYVKYPKDIEKYNDVLARGNGPGTAMQMLADLEEDAVDMPKDAAVFYYYVLDEWCSLFKEEIRYIVNYHVRGYDREWYLPLLLQDVYTRIYDGDGKFDGIEYGEDEW